MGYSSLSFLRPLRKVSEYFSKVASGTDGMGKDAISDQEEEISQGDEVEGATAAQSLISNPINMQKLERAGLILTKKCYMNLYPLGTVVGF